MSYRQDLESLISMRQSNRGVLNRYGYLMDDVGMSYHRSKDEGMSYAN